jgi:energy-coupling factor transporter ATP-binding protein EcfA2
VTAVLSLAGARFAYPGVRGWALDGVDLEIGAGRVIGVAGANGAGKSTLCLVAAGLAPSVTGGRLEGTVRLLGADVRDLPPHRAAECAGLLVATPSAQLSGTASTAWEEIAFGPRNLGLTVAEVVERVDAAIEALGIARLTARDPGRLSGGEAQLVALAAVVALRPALLVLDEPTARLDPAGASLVCDAIGRLAASGRVAVLVAEHRTSLLADVAHEVVILDAGRVALRGPAARVLADPRLRALGVAPPPVRGSERERSRSWAPR